MQGKPICTIVVPELPPRPGKAHTMAIFRAKARWECEIYYQAYAQGWREPRTPVARRRRVEIVFQRPGPVSDLDNAYAAAKVPLDATVRAGLLKDDSPRWCDLHVTTVSGKPTQTTITVWDADDDDSAAAA